MYVLCSNILSMINCCTYFGISQPRRLVWYIAGVKDRTEKKKLTENLSSAAELKLQLFWSVERYCVSIFSRNVWKKCLPTLTCPVKSLRFFCRQKSRSFASQRSETPAARMYVHFFHGFDTWHWKSYYRDMIWYSMILSIYGAVRSWRRS